MQEMIIRSLFPSNYQWLVVLKEKNADRYLAIHVGPGDAHSILSKLDSSRVLRPLTHSLLHTLIDTLGGSLQQILLNDLRDDTVHANITIQAGDSSHDIDCRPGDAIALSVWTHLPLFADDSVLNKAGFLVNIETGELVLANKTPAEVTEEELRGMSAFTGLVGSLDLEDFGAASK